MREDELEELERKIYAAMEEISFIVDRKYKIDPIDIACILGAFMGSICSNAQDFIDLLNIQVTFNASMVETIKKNMNGTILTLTNPDKFMQD